MDSKKEAHSCKQVSDNILLPEEIILLSLYFLNIKSLLALRCSNKRLNRFCDSILFIPELVNNKAQLVNFFIAIVERPIHLPLEKKSSWELCKSTSIYCRLFTSRPVLFAKDNNPTAKCCYKVKMSFQQLIDKKNSLTRIDWPTKSYVLAKSFDAENIESLITKDNQETMNPWRK
jgi:F-box domain